MEISRALGIIILYFNSLDEMDMLLIVSSHDSKLIRDSSFNKII
jgi:hypothetical protein